MRASPILLSLALLAFAGPSFGHRLDEYLQATTISLEKGRIGVDMRLSPGVAVAPFVIAAIDQNGDDVISPAEESAYVGRLLADISLTLDGDTLPLHLSSRSFASVQDMRAGMGEIHLAFLADIPRQDVGARKLLFENGHLKQIATYLVNAVVPADPDLRIAGQKRNFQQSSYRLEYTQARVSIGSFSWASWSRQQAWLIAAALLMTTRFLRVWWRRQFATAK